MTRTTIDQLLREARTDSTGSSRGGLAAQQAGALLIDTRSPDERRRDGVIPGALHIPRTCSSGGSTRD